MKRAYALIATLCIFVSTAAPAADKITLGEGPGTLFSGTALHYAKEYGFLKKHGLDVSEIKGYTPSLAVSELLVGRLDVMFGQATAWTGFAKEPERFVIVANLDTRMSLALITLREVSKAEHLKGHIVAVNECSDDFSQTGGSLSTERNLRSWLFGHHGPSASCYEENSLPLEGDRVYFIQSGGSGERLGLLQGRRGAKKGVVKGATMNAPAHLIALEDPKFHMLAGPDDFPAVPELAVVTTWKCVGDASCKDRVTRLIRAHREAQVHLTTKENEVLSKGYMKRRYPHLKDHHIEDMLLFAKKNWAPDPRSLEETVRIAGSVYTQNRQFVPSKNLYFELK